MAKKLKKIATCLYLTPKAKRALKSMADSSGTPRGDIVSAMILKDSK